MIPIILRSNYRKEIGLTRMSFVRKKTEMLRRISSRIKVTSQVERKDTVEKPTREQSLINHSFGRQLPILPENNDAENTKDSTMLLNNLCRINATEAPDTVANFIKEQEGKK